VSELSVRTRVQLHPLSTQSLCLNFEYICGLDVQLLLYEPVASNRSDLRITLHRCPLWLILRYFKCLDYTLRFVDQLRDNDREISKYTTDVAK
jgi:hypothetical protein